MLAPLKGMMSILATTMSRHRPTLVNGSVGFTTFAAGDVLAQGAFASPDISLEDTGSKTGITGTESNSWLQTFVDRTTHVDYERSVKVGLLGVALNGFVLGYWYKVLDRYLGASRTSMKGIFSKIVADQMCYAPFTITSFVTYAAVLNGGGPKKIWEETRHNMSETFVSTWLMDWRIWPAANFVMFRYIPSSYRPSCASFVSVAWQTYLSYVSFNPHAPTIKSHTPDAAAQVRGGGIEGIPVSSDPAVVSASSQLPTVNTQRRQMVYSNSRRMTSRYAYFGPTKEISTTSCEDNGIVEGKSDVASASSGTREGGTSSNMHWVAGGKDSQSVVDARVAKGTKGL